MLAASDVSAWVNILTRRATLCKVHPVGDVCSTERFRLIDSRDKMRGSLRGTRPATALLVSGTAGTGKSYEQVNDNAIDLRSIQSPNRHAAMHGLVPYPTHKHSLNMLILADYVFRVLPPDHQGIQSGEEGN